MKPRIKSMIGNTRKKKNIPSEQQEVKRIQKHEDRLSSLLDIFECTNIQIIGVLEGENSQKLKTYLKK